MNLIIDHQIQVGLILFSIFGIPFIYYLIDRHETNRQQFRDKIRPGDMVRVKTTNGIVRARVMLRNKSTLTLKNIDSNEKFISNLKKIYSL